MSSIKGSVGQIAESNLTNWSNNGRSDKGFEDEKWLLWQLWILLKFKKPFSRPLVRFHVLDKFKEYVIMSLKELELWILHLTDVQPEDTRVLVWLKERRFSSVIYFRYGWLILEHQVNFKAIVGGNLQMMYLVSK